MRKVLVSTEIFLRGKGCQILSNKIPVQLVFCLVQNMQHNNTENMKWFLAAPVVERHLLPAQQQLFMETQEK